VRSARLTKVRYFPQDISHTRQRLLTSEEDHDGLPSHSQVLRGGKNETFKGSIHSINTVIEQLTKRTTLVSTSSTICQPHSRSQEGNLRNVRLTAIYCIESLIQEQPNSPTDINPRRTILIERRVIPEQRQQINNHKAEPAERDQVGRHAHRETLDDHICIERFQDVARQQRVVDTGVLVLFQVRQVLLADVDHFEDWGRARTMEIWRR